MARSVDDDMLAIGPRLGGDRFQAAGYRACAVEGRGDNRNSWSVFYVDI